MKEKRLLGAAIDVFPEEPTSNNEPFVSPLLGCDNVLLTPHIGGSTLEAQENIGFEVAEKLVRYSDNGSTLSAVNFPEVSLPAHPASHRLLHIHQNIPGVLSRINAVFGAIGVNIAAQYLQTNAEIGYVVIDVEAEHSQAALEKLREVEGTIRTRVLFSAAPARPPYSPALELVQLRRDRRKNPRPNLRRLVDELVLRFGDIEHLGRNSRSMTRTL